MADSLMTTQTVRPAPGRGAVFDAHGRLLRVPDGWELLPPGDATLTRRVKEDGPHWAVVVQRGRRCFSQGVWAAAATIARHRADLERERQSVVYQDRLVAQRRRREREQGLYVAEFRDVVLQVLRFAPCHRETAERLADAVAAQATPVGSGTVARTQRLGLEEKAELALMAWLRHQTSDYDRRQVARIKGERRAVRRQIAVQSRQLLERYRHGDMVDPATCPLQQALAGGGSEAVPPVVDGPGRSGAPNPTPAEGVRRDRSPSSVTPQNGDPGGFWEPLPAPGCAGAPRATTAPGKEPPGRPGRLAPVPRKPAAGNRPAPGAWRDSFDDFFTE
jgi:hypothetical protein